MSRDRSSTFFKKIPNCLKRPKTLFHSRPTVAWPPTTVAWPFSDFIQNFSYLLETSEKFVWKSADGGVTVRLLCFRVFFRTAPHTLAYVVLLVLNVSFRRTGQHSVYFDHVTPRGEGQTWILWYQMKDIFKEKRIFDFGGKILTRWFPRRETNSPFLSLATYLLLEKWFNSKNFEIVSKPETGRKEFLILVGKFQLVDSLWGKQVPHYKHRRRSINTVSHIIYVTGLCLQFSSYCT